MTLDPNLQDACPGYVLVFVGIFPVLIQPDSLHSRLWNINNMLIFNHSFLTYSDFHWISLIIFQELTSRRINELEFRKIKHPAHRKSYIISGCAEKVKTKTSVRNNSYQRDKNSSSNWSLNQSLNTARRCV